MTFAQQTGHFVSPANYVELATAGGRLHRVSQISITTDRNGQIDLKIQKFFNKSRCAPSTGIDHVENTPAGLHAGRLSIRRKIGKHRVHREPEDLDLI